MKKLIKVLGIILLILSILIVSTLIIANAVTIIRIMFFGVTVGSDVPDTIWWQKMELYGLEGIKTYYSVWSDLLIYFEVPITIVCLIYQIIYLKIIKSKK